MRLLLLFYLMLVIPLCTVGQDGISPVESLDSISTYLPDSDDAKDSQAAADSSVVEARHFKHATLSELKTDPGLNYRETPTVAENLWDRFLTLLQQFIDSLFRNAISTDWGKVFSYTIAIVLIVIVIMMLLRVNAFKIFYSGEGASSMPYHVMHENIHEMDFDKLIDDAIIQHDYRKGIRLLFLKSLKMLADKHFIHWEQGKTNHDYLSELTSEDLKPGFNDLNYYFEYAWYGNFSINHDMFLRVQNLFADWSRQLR